MKIRKITKNRLRNDAHFQFHTDFKDLVAAAGAQKLKIQAQFDAYLPLYGREDEGLKIIKKSALTEKVQEADKARDEIFAGMVEASSAMLKHFAPEKQEAAKNLKILFDTYGNIAVKSYKEQTSATYNLLQELNGKYADYAATAGIGDWASELEAKNNAFNELMNERDDETLGKTDVVLKEARAGLDKAYDVIAERIDALALVEGGEVYDSFIKAFNLKIERYARLIGGKRNSNNPENGGSNEQD